MHVGPNIGPTGRLGDRNRSAVDRQGTLRRRSTSGQGSGRQVVTATGKKNMSGHFDRQNALRRVPTSGHVSARQVASATEKERTSVMTDKVPTGAANGGLWLSCLWDGGGLVEIIIELLYVRPSLLSQDMPVPRRRNGGGGQLPLPLGQLTVARWRCRDKKRS